jgi:hypothetical protein
MCKLFDGVYAESAAWGVELRMWRVALMLK